MRSLGNACHGLRTYLVFSHLPHCSVRTSVFCIFPLANEVRLHIVRGALSDLSGDTRGS